MIPVYPLYALLFADSGLSPAQISSLLAIWSAASFLAEVPAGALADLLDRRAVIVAAEALRAAGFAVWALRPSYLGFAAGFVIWGIAGSLISGAMEALIYDRLAADGQARHFAAVLGRVRGAGLLAQAPVAAAAALMFALGGYMLAVWASVGASLAAAALASRLPDPREDPREDRRPDSALRPGEGAGAASASALLRDGWRQVARRPAVRRAVISVATLGGLDAAEEYFGLILRSRGVPTGIVPFALAAVALCAAVCAVLAGRGRGWGGVRLVLLLAGGSAALALAACARASVAIGLVALYYGAGKLVLVVHEARLQHQLTESSRATATSMAALATEIACFAVYGAWAVRGAAGLVAAGVVAALILLVLTLADARPVPRRAGDAADPSGADADVERP